MLILNIKAHEEHENPRKADWQILTFGCTDPEAVRTPQPEKALRGRERRQGSDEEPFMDILANVFEKQSDDVEKAKKLLEKHGYRVVK